MDPPALERMNGTDYIISDTNISSETNCLSSYLPNPKQWVFVVSGNTESDHSVYA